MSNDQDNRNMGYFIWTNPGGGIAFILSRKVGTIPLKNFVDALICIAAVGGLAYITPLKLPFKLLLVAVFGGLLAYISVKGFGEQSIFSYIKGFLQGRDKVYVLMPALGEDEPEPEEEPKEPFFMWLANKLEDMANGG